MDLGPTSSLADRFKQALDFCDAAGARAEQTPVATDPRPRQVSFADFSQPPLVQPSGQALFAAPQIGHPQRTSQEYGGGGGDTPEALQLTAKGNGGGTLKTISIVVGVLLLAAAAWFVRHRFIEPFFARRRQRGFDDACIADLETADQPAPRQRGQTRTAGRVRFEEEELLERRKPRSVLVSAPKTALATPQRQPVAKSGGGAASRQREALRAAQQMAAARVATQKTQHRLQEEQTRSHHSEDEEEAFSPDDEERDQPDAPHEDPNFTEL